MDENHIVHALKATRADMLDHLPYAFVVMVGTFGGIVLTALLVPSSYTGKTQAIASGISGLIVAILLVLFFFLWNLYRAPFRQRDQARRARDKAERRSNELEHPTKALDIKLLSVTWQPTQGAPDQRVPAAYYSLLVSITNGPEEAAIGRVGAYLELENSNSRVPLDWIPKENANIAPSFFAGSPPQLDRPYFEANLYFRPRESRMGYFVFFDRLVGQTEVGHPPNCTLVIGEGSGFLHSLTLGINILASELGEAAL